MLLILWHQSLRWIAAKILELPLMTVKLFSPIIKKLFIFERLLQNRSPLRQPASFPNIASCCWRYVIFALAIRNSCGKVTDNHLACYLQNSVGALQRVVRIE